MNDRSLPPHAGESAGSDDPVFRPEHQPKIDRALLRTINLSVGLIVGIEFGLEWLLGRGTPMAWGPTVYWWAFVLGFAATELAVFDVELSGEQTTFTLAEIPLVLGLFLFNPLAVVVTRLVGTLLVLVLHTRQMPRKMLLNLASSGAECVVAFVIFDQLAGDAHITNPRS